MTINPMADACIYIYRENPVTSSQVSTVSDYFLKGPLRS